MTNNSAHTQTLWAKSIITAIADAGIRMVFASPGSRSTPLVLAAFDEPRLALHVVIDERSAGFAALGAARATGTPAALLCTSGSALLHYAPALVEAEYAGVPIVALSADRPPRLRGCGASQTIDQPRAYGSFVRAVVDIEPATATLAAFVNARNEVMALVARAQREHCAVHLNVSFDKPLEPRAADSDAERAFEAAIAAALSAVPMPPQPADKVATAADPALAIALDTAAAALRVAARVVIVAGALPRWRAATPAAVWELSLMLAAPVLAEPASQLRFDGDGSALRLDGIGPILESPPGRRALACDLILQLGPAPTATETLAWMDEHRGPRIVVHDHGAADPLGTATQRIDAPVSTVVAGLCARLKNAPLTRSTAFMSRAMAAAEMSRGLIEAKLASSGNAAMEEGDAVAAVLAALPLGCELFIGNSLPIREADHRGPVTIDGVTVHSQRGAAGIDGNIAGVAGLALATRRPVVALLGDVAFAHDVGSLAIARTVATPLVLIVIDNAGGRIFDALPVAASTTSDKMELLFTTAPHLELIHAARAHGIDYLEVRDAPAIRPALSRALATKGSTLVHLRVAPHSAAAHRDRLRQAVRSAPWFDRLNRLAPTDVKESIQ